MNIKQIPCNPTNYRKGRKQDIKYLVVHYTANNGDTAIGNCNYFANNANLRASAHYFVDENEVYQSVSDFDTAWHCGGTSYIHPECRNDNAIGIEMCSRKDNNGNYYFKDETVANTIELVKEKMAEYNIDVNHVLMHWHITGKKCPAPFVDDKSKWTNFKSRLIEEEEDMVRYNKLSDIPNEWKFRDIIEILMNAKIINGDGSDQYGNDDVIDLSHDQVRSLIFQYNGGAFDRKLIKEGFNPAVSD